MNHSILLSCAFAVISSIAAMAQSSTLSVVPAQVNYKGTLPPLIDRALLFDDPQVSGGQISPDGKWVTFMKPYKGERNVWVKAIDEPFDAARPLTALDRPVPGYFWTHDSESVLFVQDAAGDENYHVYAVDPSATVKGPELKLTDRGVPTARALTSGSGVRAQIVSVPRSKPNTIYVGLNDRDPAFHDLYALDIATGKKTLVYENTNQVSSYVFDHAGELRMATKSNDAGGTEIYRLGEDGEMVKVYECNVDETCYPSGFAAGNKEVYVVSNKGNVDKTELLLLNPQTMATTLVDKDPEGEVDFGGAITSDVTHEILGTRYTGDKPRVYWRDEAWQADYDFLKSKLGDVEVSLGSSTADERKFVVYGSSDVDAGTAYIFDRDKRTVDEFYTLRPELADKQLAEMKPVRYKSTDGLEIPAYLTLPIGVEAKNLPVVMFIHGGPWARDGWGFHPYAQF